jgi:hypothetical protein
MGNGNFSMKMVMRTNWDFYPGKKVEYGNHITLTVQLCQGMG